MKALVRIVTLGGAVLMSCVAHACQQHDLDEAWRKWNSDLARPLQDLISEGSFYGHRLRPMSRAEFGVMTWQWVQLAEDLGSRIVESRRVSDWERPFAANFWRIELLVERHASILVEFGIERQDVEGRMSRAREGLRSLHPDVFLSVFDRFQDVPRGHWADEAFHSLRRAGILVGYPDNTIRP